jgi:sugar O-acyltransferase (sialic acid O-acetyltransferase NeuD family)
VKLLVVGAGGHAKVVIDAAVASGWEIAGVLGLPSDPADVLGHAVVHDATAIPADAFIIAIGDNRIRARRFQELIATGLEPASVVHPSATIGSRVEMGAGSFVAPGAIVNTCARIGRDAIVNTGCTVDHDCVVGDHALVGPTASMCGTSSVGEGVTLGAGASLIPGVSVGEWTVVGAGAAVVDDLPSHATCVGVPARVIATTEG